MNSKKMTAAERAKAEAVAKKVIARNKKASHEYHIEDRYEAGLSLTGTEVKALRQGRASLVDGWVEIDRGEAWLQGAHISEYAQGLAQFRTGNLYEWNVRAEISWVCKRA